MKHTLEQQRLDAAVQLHITLPGAEVDTGTLPLVAPSTVSSLASQVRGWPMLVQQLVTASQKAHVQRDTAHEMAQPDGQDLTAARQPDTSQQLDSSVHDALHEVTRDCQAAKADVARLTQELAASTQRWADAEAELKGVQAELKCMQTAAKRVADDQKQELKHACTEAGAVS